MKRIRNFLAAMLFVASTGGALVTIAAPQPVSAACNDRVLGFPAWYKGLTTSSCEIRSPSSVNGGISTFIWTIVLNIIEFLLQLVGYLAVAYIIVGGYRYMTSAGSPDGMSKAKTTILNAVIGLVISILSVAIVNLIANSIG